MLHVTCYIYTLRSLHVVWLISSAVEVNVMACELLLAKGASTCPLPYKSRNALTLALTTALRGAAVNLFGITAKSPTLLYSDPILHIYPIHAAFAAESTEVIEMTLEAIESDEFMAKGMNSKNESPFGTKNSRSQLLNPPKCYCLTSVTFSRNI